ncbi:hypothetical protein [Amycolatopsis sp. NPDC004625]|uniref:hypothetical protein n=1 Tax=Amycolatopsis sp. NPDC004625 TaxID=3154670 RepID=UPI0033B1D496
MKENSAGPADVGAIPLPYSELRDEYPRCASACTFGVSAAMSLSNRVPSSPIASTLGVLAALG